jgi:hypothetical protein
MTKKQSKNGQHSACCGAAPLLGHMVKNPTYQIIIKNSSGKILNNIKSWYKNPFLLSMAVVTQILQDSPNESLNLEISCLDSGKSTSETSII